MDTVTSIRRDVHKGEIIYETSKLLRELPVHILDREAVYSGVGSVNLHSHCFEELDRSNPAVE